MQVSEILKFSNVRIQGVVEVEGWLVDCADGLYILGDHFPENYDHPERIRILNGNIMYSILRSVALLGGGKSMLFYRSKAIGSLSKERGLIVDRLFLQSDRRITELFEVEIDSEFIEKRVKESGDYKFRVIDPMRDWLDDFC